mgnify:CR=1 FL=1
MARTYGPGGEMKKRKKGEPFNSKGQTKSRLANARLPFINIDNLEDPVGTLRDSGYKDPDVMDFPSGGNYRKGSDVLDRLIDLELVKKKKKSKKRKA